MADAKLSRVAAFAAANQEKALALIEPLVAPGDAVVAFGQGWRYPLDVLTWLPLIGDIIAMRKKRFLLAVTRHSVVVMQVRKFRWEALATEVIPAASVVSAEVRQFPLFCNLRLTLRDGHVLLFKEMLREHADEMKDAVDAAGGRGSSVG